MDGEEGELVDLAIKAVEMLAAVKPAADRGGADADVGAGLSGGELPMAQATVLCILRVGIIERLGETGQARPLHTHRVPSVASSTRCTLNGAGQHGAWHTCPNLTLVEQATAAAAVC